MDNNSFTSTALVALALEEGATVLDRKRVETATGFETSDKICHMIQYDGVKIYEPGLQTSVGIGLKANFANKAEIMPRARLTTISVFRTLATAEQDRAHGLGRL